MKTILKGIIAAAVLTLAMSAAQPVHAAAFNQVLTVQDAGINEAGEVELLLYSADRDVAKRFVAAAGDENMVLAIGLTALSTGKPVLARTEWSAQGSAIEAIRLLSSAP